MREAKRMPVNIYRNLKSRFSCALLSLVRVNGLSVSEYIENESFRLSQYNRSEKDEFARACQIHLNSIREQKLRLHFQNEIIKSYENVLKCVLLSDDDKLKELAKDILCYNGVIDDEVEQ